MEITSRFNREDFEVWIDHFQYLDIGERHQSVPSGKSYIRGKFDPEQDAYIIDKIHIDPDMLRTDVKEELLHEAKLQAHKRDKRLLRENRVAAMPRHRKWKQVDSPRLKIHEPKSESRMRMERDRPAEHRPMVTRDLQTAIWRVADSLARSLKDPQGATPGDARWTVSGLSHSSWAINHPDIMTDGESPLTLRIKKLPDGRWVAFGQNRLTNLMNTKILAIKKTPPGGDDWDDIDTFASTTATYFQEQKANILALKQAMTPQNAPGAGYGGQSQEVNVSDVGAPPGMGGPMAGRMARRRKAAEFNLTPAQAMNALQIKGTGDVEQDRAALKAIIRKSHPDVASGPLAQIRMTAANVLMETYLRRNQPLPTTAAQAEEAGQGAVMGGPETVGEVNEMVRGYVSDAVTKAERLTQSIPTAGRQFSKAATLENIKNLNRAMFGATKAIDINLGTENPRAKNLRLTLMRASNFLNEASRILSGPDMSQQILNKAIESLNGFIQMGRAALNSVTTKRSSRRASATLDNLRKAQRIAHQIHRAYGDQDWFLGVRVINDRDGIALGIGAAEVPPRGLRAALEGVPLILEGPGGRMVRAQQEGQKRLRLAMRLAAEVAEEMGIDPAEEKELKHHQRLVRRVYNQIKNNKRLFGSVRYMSRKMGIEFNDLVRVIGQLIVEGKIEMTKKKKFRMLPEPHTPVPGMAGKFAATNSIFGIDRGRSDKRVDQLLTHSNYQFNTDEHMDRDDAAVHRRDLRERPSKIMPDPTQPN